MRRDRRFNFIFFGNYAMLITASDSIVKNIVVLPIASMYFLVFGIVYKSRICHSASHSIVNTQMEHYVFSRQPP